jgi:hypothetical protein
MHVASSPTFLFKIQSEAGRKKEDLTRPPESRLANDDRLPRLFKQGGLSQPQSPVLAVRIEIIMQPRRQPCLVGELKVAQHKSPCCE